jgi:hypothetical protein
VIAVEAEADGLLSGEVLREPLAEGVGVLVDPRHRVATARQAQGERAAHPPASVDDDVHGVSLQRRDRRRLPSTLAAREIE